MSDYKKKTYVGKSKAKSQNTNFGLILKLGFHAETLIAFAKEHANAAGYLNLDIVPRREPDQYGNDYSVALNDWKPDSSEARQAQPETRLAAPKAEKPSEDQSPKDDSDLPF